MKSLEKITADLSQIKYSDFFQFLCDFLRAIGIPNTTISKITSSISRTGGNAHITLYRRATFFETSDDSDCVDSYLQDLDTDFLLLIGPHRITIYDAKKMEKIACLYADLKFNVNFFLSLIYGEEKDISSSEDFASTVNVLFNDLLLAGNPINLVVDFIFASIYLSFGDYHSGKMLRKYLPIHLMKKIESPDTFLQEIFSSFFHEHRSQYFPQNITWSIPIFQLKQVPMLGCKSLSCFFDILHIDWKTVDIGIAGSLIYKFVKPGENNTLYGHFTAEQNIDKVLQPLFLRDFDSRIWKFKKDIKVLHQIGKEITALNFLDPTDGPGCFLSRCITHVSYLLDRIRDFSKSKVNFSVNIENYIAIVSNQISEKTTKLLIWMTYCETQKCESFEKKYLKSTYSRLQVVKADPLLIDWKKVCPNYGHTLIIGSPTFCGNKKIPSAEKRKMSQIFGSDSLSALDYSATWLMLAAKYIGTSGSKSALVLTNSVCQGEQVATLWPHIFSAGCEIFFAYRSFKWNNGKEGQTGVTVIIVGLSSKNCVSDKLLFTEFGTYYHARTIGPYLIADSSSIVKKRTKPICSDFPLMPKGNMPYDSGHLLLQPQEKDDLLKEYPQAKRFLKKIVGAEEFINNVERWCLWIRETDIEQATQIAPICERINAVREARLASPDAGAHRLADIPYRFRENNETTSQTLVIPSVSSENRQYIPMGFIGADTIVTNLAFAIYDVDPWIMGVISSKMHMLWIRTVCGALETRIRYSSRLGYNTFPFPSLNEEQKTKIRGFVFDIISTREKYYEKSLGDLYSSLPRDLRMIHQYLDVFIENCYRDIPFESDYERIHYLLRLYDEQNSEKE